MKRPLVFSIVFCSVAMLTVLGFAWTPIVVKEDPLVRMPGSQPTDGVNLESPNRCLNCHAGYNSGVEPGFNWKGSMMAQSARDFIFYSCLTVAAQDSLWATGTPNAGDICVRCHFPKGWLEDRSDPVNATRMTGADFDGVQCDMCHRMYDPFFENSFNGTREGDDWLNYWDETNLGPEPSDISAQATYDEDALQAQIIRLFNGNPFFENNLPKNSNYTENGSGQFLVSTNSDKRSSFADAAARHQMLYSRYNKSRYFCSTCHDVSNPVLANLPHAGTAPGDGTTVLPTEENSAFSYFHVERTFSEFMLSDYADGAGSAGRGYFSPDIFETSNPNNVIAKCQDCHMRDVVGKGCNKNGVPIRPTESVEHPQSGQPLHDLTGGNVWVSTVLASAVQGSPNYDATNDALLNQGPDVLTLDLSQGEGIDPDALLAGADRAMQQLEMAAEITNLTYDASTGALSFRVQNNTGHKLISGFPEGRRMFVNVKAYQGGALVYEVNSYDDTVGTLKGLPTVYSPDSPALAANEAYVESLVYEMHPSSALTGEDKTFHFALADGRYKDNRIPPKGFRIADAAARLSEPVSQGEAAPDYFTDEEYAGGYDAVSLTIPSGADSVMVTLYYQTTSREYIAFLRDEINGTGNLTLSSPTLAGETNAYIVQTDPFFAQLKAWGDTVWRIWDHNKSLPGAAPVVMAQASTGQAQEGLPCDPPIPGLTATPGQKEVSLAWTDVHSDDPDVIGYHLYYDQAGKKQSLVLLDLQTSYLDSNLTDGQQYCYAVTAVYAECESDYSNVACAIPTNSQSTDIGVTALNTGLLETTGKGKNQTTTFLATSTFTPGDTIVVLAEVKHAGTSLPIADATVELTINGPETAVITSTASDAQGIAEAAWTTQAPNKKGMNGTTPGSYSIMVTNVTAAGYTWDDVQIATSFDIQ